VWLTVTYFVSCSGGCKFHKSIKQVEYIHYYNKQNNVIISCSTSHFISVANLVCDLLLVKIKINNILMKTAGTHSCRWMNTTGFV